MAAGAIPEDLHPALRLAVERYILSGHRLKDWTRTTATLIRNPTGRDELRLYAGQFLAELLSPGSSWGFFNFASEAHLFVDEQGCVWRRRGGWGLRWLGLKEMA